MGGEAELRRLLSATVQEAAGAVSAETGVSPPVFLRVPVDWPQADASVESRRSAAVAAAKAATAGGVEGLILTARGRSEHSLLQEMLTDAYSEINGDLVLIADGVTSGIEALECIEADATVVQISSLLLTEGPGACRRIK